MSSIKILRFPSLLALCFSVLAVMLVPATASAWAPAKTAAIHPGVQVFTEGAQCTSNFVFQDGSEVYLGQAAHCSGTGEATDTDGCAAASLPIGTAVEVTGASRPGQLAYSSWNTMKAKGESDADACAYNDFALIRIDPADVGKINPSVPGFGGPTAVGGTGGLGSSVYSYGNSSLRLGIRQLSPKQGIVLQNEASGWSHNVLTVTPGIPGDSGSGFLNDKGEAFGTLSTLQFAPAAGSNGVGNLTKELNYMRANAPALSGVQLVRGTEPFSAKLGLLLGTPSDTPPSDTPPSDTPPSDAAAGSTTNDTTPPRTTIKSKPKKSSTKRKARFTFASSEAGSTFRCKLDKGGYRSCASPFSKKVKVAKHTFSVIAIDRAGNKDKSAATYKWKVKKPRR